MSDIKVKSFEVSDSESLGDIVSRDRKARPNALRVGLICAGWFEWWPMFPHSGLEKAVRADAETCASTLSQQLGARVEWVYPGMIDTLDSGFDAGELFSRQSVDCILLVETSYLTDFIPIEALDHLPSVPLIILNTQATRNLPAAMTNIDVIRYEGLVGVAQLVGALKKMGREYRVVVGALDDPDTYSKVGGHLQSLSIVKHLKRVDVGLLGHTFRGMYDIEIDKTKIKGALGLNTLYIDVQHLVSTWKKVTDDEVRGYSDHLQSLLPIESWGVTEEDRLKSLRLGLAMQRLAARFNLDCLSVLGQHHVEVATRTSADFSFYSVEKSGVMTTHEGDLANLAMKKILYELSGTLPVFLEWTAFDESSNCLLLTHHGVVDPEPFADLASCRWTPSPEKWDFHGAGYSIEYSAKAGEVTLASLIDDSGGWKLLISRGECVDRAASPCFAPQFYFRPQSDVKEFIGAFLTEGVTHHVCLVYGDFRAKLELLAGYLGIRKVVLEA